VDPTRFRRLMDLVGEALERPADVRVAWLEEQCGADRELLAEAISLESESDLAQLEDLTAQLEARVGRAAAITMSEGPAFSRAGQRVGPYRLLDVLGQGGMGTVYLAERADGAYRGRVAIKFVRGLLAAPDLEERFRTERQILADLSHPNITRLLDGGTTADGTPFLVMEYLEGALRIDTWCVERGLDVRERLELFLQVCGAVAYAHYAGVIHRDIKPSNILVPSGGTPKLVDFGIAKLLDSGGEPGYTATVRALTPAYASPEQLLGEPASVASDVYSLGVVLYELLAGRAPFDVGGRSAIEVERKIMRGGPQPPSEAATPPVTVRPLPGAAALDAVVLRALQRDPDKRFRSVDEFANSLKRFLQLSPGRLRMEAMRHSLPRAARRPRTWTAVGGLATAAALTFSLAAERAAARSAALGPYEFLAVQTSAPAIPAPNQVRSCDVNGDGRVDLVWNHLASGTNSTQVGVASTDGTFAIRPPRTHSATPPDGWQDYQLLTGDFDGDGRCDLAWQHIDPDDGRNRVYLAFSNEDGLLRSSEPISLGASRWAAEWKALIGDMNGDGADDLVFSYLAGSNLLRLVLSNRDGTFREIPPITHLAPGWRDYRAFVGDVDGDGVSDVIWNNVPAQINRIYVATPRGSRVDLLGQQDHPDTTGWSDHLTHLGDVDGDGRSDLVWVAAGLDPIAVDVALGNELGQFTFKSRQNIPRPANVGALTTVLADANGDGRRDLIWIESGGRQNRFWVAPARGTGAFDSDPTAFEHPLSLTGELDWAGPEEHVLILDVDGDGRNDLVWDRLSDTHHLYVGLARPPE
jgi:serine/threonine protein kinase